MDETQKAETKKPGAGAGFFVDSCEERATGYPAGWLGSGRRAREVIPAAMRALVTICGWAAIRDIVLTAFNGSADLSGKPDATQ
ncbi:hypothetical protein [Dokdonella sp.]|uniref:hypothetical protein n=1 Tax=Dokdonella sp. TaxID=2291710 RepID=UPI002F42B68E